MNQKQMEEIKGIISTAIGSLREEVRQNGAAIGELREGVQRNETAITDLREETAGLRDEVRGLGVVVEGLRHEIHQVAEGVVNVDEKLEREVTALRQEMKAGFADVKALVKLSYGELDRRVRILEGQA